MIKGYLVPLHKAGAIFNAIADKEGLLPLCCCHVPTKDGPGFIFGLVGEGGGVAVPINEESAVEEQPDVGGNGSDALEPTEILPAAQ